MKTKAIIALALSLLFSTAINAKTAQLTSPVTEAMTSLSGETGVINLNLHGTLLGFGKMLLKQTPLKNISKGIKQLSVLMGEDLPPAQRTKIDKTISESLKAYQILIQTRDEDEKVSVYALESAKKGYLSEVVMSLSDGSDMMVISMLGEISLDDISKAIQETEKK